MKIKSKKHITWDHLKDLEQKKSFPTNILKGITQEHIWKWIASWCGMRGTVGQPKQHRDRFPAKDRMIPSMCPIYYKVRINSPRS